MAGLAVAFIVCLATIFAHVLFRRDHTINGAAGNLAFGGLFLSGLALAIHALA